MKAILNDRLSCCRSTSDSSITAHFLVGSMPNEKRLEEIKAIPISNQRWSEMRQVVLSFSRTRKTNYYLSQLQRRTKWIKHRESSTIGTTVLFLFFIYFLQNLYSAGGDVCASLSNFESRIDR